MKDSNGFVWLFIGFITILYLLNDNSHKKREVTTDSISLDAGFAASQYVSAQKDCKIIGYTDLGLCAKNKGQLIDETMAVTTAEFALRDIRDYQKDCRSKFSIDYCKSLLSRAISIELNKIRQEKNDSDTSTQLDDELYWENEY